MKLLTQNDWQLAALTISPPANGSDDIYKEFDECEKDDISTFNLNHTYVLNEGNSKCKPTDKQIIASGQWEFTKNESHILFDKKDNYTIIQLEENDLKISNSTIIDGASYTFTETYINP